MAALRQTCQPRRETKPFKTTVQPAKARPDLLLVNVDRQVEVSVEVAVQAHPIVGFVNGVEQVDDNDGDVYSPSMLVVPRSARLRLSVTGSYRDAVV